MVLSLADYRILSDSGFILPRTNGNKEITFTTSSISSIETNSAQMNPYLSFQVDPRTDVVEYEIDVNDKTIKSGKHNSNGNHVARVLQEPFPASWINKNDNNTIQFRIIKGKAAFGEVILHFQQRRDLKLN